MTLYRVYVEYTTPVLIFGAFVKDETTRKIVTIEADAIEEAHTAAEMHVKMDLPEAKFVRALRNRTKYARSQISNQETIMRNRRVIAGITMLAASALPIGEATATEPVCPPAAVGNPDTLAACLCAMRKPLPLIDRERCALPDNPSLHY